MTGNVPPNHASTETAEDRLAAHHQLAKITRRLVMRHQATGVGFENERRRRHMEARLRAMAAKKPLPSPLEEEWLSAVMRSSEGKQIILHRTMVRGGGEKDLSIGIVQTPSIVGPRTAYNLDEVQRLFVRDDYDLSVRGATNPALDLHKDGAEGHKESLIQARAQHDLERQALEEAGLTGQVITAQEALGVRAVLLASTPDAGFGQNWFA